MTSAPPPSKASGYGEHQPDRRVRPTGSWRQRTPKNLRSLLRESIGKSGSGTLLRFKVIETGYEDVNVHVVASGGELLVKLFDRRRSLDECRRYVANIELALRAGVAHPQLRTGPSQASNLLELDDGKARSCVMDFVDAPSLMERGDDLSPSEESCLMKNVGRLSNYHSSPVPVLDTWSALALRAQVDRSPLSNSMVRRLAERVATGFELLGVDDLPTSFVHADLVPTNILCPGDGTIVIVDLGRAGELPRIHELSVLVAHTLGPKRSRNIQATIDRTLRMYQPFCSLTAIERESIPMYTAAVSASCMVEAFRERQRGNMSSENAYWLSTGLHTTLAICSEYRI